MYVLVSPCILHPDLRARGITRPDDLEAFEKFIRRCKTFNIDIVELPCPETLQFGKEREPGPFVGRMDTPEFAALLDSLESDVRRKIERETPLAIIGVNSSPTCGATTTYYTDTKSAGSGMFLKRFAGTVPVLDVKDCARYTVYFAAPLFSEAERAFNRMVADELAGLFYDVHLPQELDDDANTRAENREALIYRENLAALQAADIVVAVIDGADADSGTAWEMGYAAAKGKRILALRTDFRRFSDAESVNLMLETEAEVCTSVDELL
ncbi:MAG TPA: nucleoside 2-deoxyribosyltransferase, partial [Methanocorpusculum sp.]|nr:nucleoside 2-deoxyribosyltransferase [Methanocorpusculum sp.]